MTSFEFVIPEGKKINNVKFATKLVSKACDFSNEDIDIRTDDETWVDLKSIMGVLTLHYNTAKSITVKVTGTFEDETANELKNYMSMLLK